MFTVLPKNIDRNCKSVIYRINSFTRFKDCERAHQRGWSVKSEGDKTYQNALAPKPVRGQGLNQ
jgi:hypothetical protein